MELFTDPVVTSAWGIPLLFVAAAMLLLGVITPLVIGFGFKQREYAEWHPEEKPQPVMPLVEPVTTNTLPDGIAVVEALFRERR